MMLLNEDGEVGGGVIKGRVGVLGSHGDSKHFRCVSRLRSCARAGAERGREGGGSARNMRGTEADSVSCGTSVPLLTSVPRGPVVPTPLPPRTGFAFGGRAALKNSFFSLLSTAPRDCQPPTANCPPPPTANRQPPPTAKRQLPPTATNRQPPPTANHCSILFLWTNLPFFFALG